MNISRMTFTHSALACFAIAVLIQSVIGWHWWQAQARHDAALQTPLVQHSNALVTQSEQLLRTTLTCQAPQCTAAAPEIHTAIDQLTTTITAYQHAASQEKSQISLVGDSALPMLQVAITRFRDTQDRDTQAISTFNQAVFTFVSSQQARHQQLLQMINQQYLHTQQQLFRQGVGVFVLFGVAILILARLRQKRVASKKHPAQNAQQDIEHLANQLANIDAQGIQTQLNNLALSPAERRIYANLSAIFEDVESQKRNADLYRQLYALIGYEIRGMTNTIQGGVRLIAQDAGENGAVMARDITLATNTLSDLADNYNRLISGGNNAPTGNVSFLPLLSELVVHLTAKTQHTQRRFDCHFGDNLPEQIEGNSTSLFWVLFLQLSNAISAQSKDHTLLNIVTDAAEDVEQTRLRFDALFLPSHQMALTAIEQAQWSNVDEKSGINDEWSKAILSHVKRVKSQWAQATVTTQDDETVTLQKLRIDIDITPKRFYRVERTLEKKQVMICTDSPLQIDLMSRMLTQYGATVKVVRAANDIFKALPQIGAFDAIIITDTIKGIQLKSFCKTLSSRLKKAKKTKLFLAASESSTVQDTHEYVDKVFYTPFIAHDLIPNLTEAMQAEEDTEEQTHNTFLIVEDDRVQQFLLKQLLSKQGYDAHTVSDGSQAVEYMQDHGADIVFMDCIMPGMGGIEATKLIRQQERERNTPQSATIIGATALTSASEHKLCIEAGMDYVISKPYKNDEIIKVIKKYMAIQKIC